MEVNVKVRKKAAAGLVKRRRLPGSLVIPGRDTGRLPTAHRMGF